MARRGIDLSTMTHAERICASIGLGLFINTLIPWWYRIRTPNKTFLHNGGLFGWGLITASIGFAAALIAVARHVRTPAAFNDRSIYASLGVVCTILLLVHASRASSSIWIGFYAEIALAAGLIVGGLARIRERNRGWI
ncbi:MAG: hypothetical protein ACYDCC_02715 [Actinomycetota bacterium]